MNKGTANLKSAQSMKAFQNDAEGIFIERPNRYIVRILTGKQEIIAHCPNPGRMEELLIPGCRVILQKADKPERKTRWSLAAVYYKDQIIPLDSTISNSLAGELLSSLYGKIDFSRKEFTYGRSRFDWMFTRNGSKNLLEIKSCTLVAEKRAMFPDAPSTRALKHLTHLAEQNEYIPRVLFMIYNTEAERFTPNRHTDPDFSMAVSCFNNKIDFRACSLKCDHLGNIQLINPELQLDFPEYREDSGIYLIVLKLETEATIESIGGKQFFLNPGFYIYAGSAKKNLKSRISRHKRIRKKKHWHLDYLRPFCKWIKSYPIVTDNDLECRAAGLMKEIADEEIKRFGCSDCKCESHLFYFKSNPVKDIRFQDRLLLLRHKLAF